MTLEDFKSFFDEFSVCFLVAFLCAERWVHEHSIAGCRHSSDLLIVNAMGRSLVFAYSFASGDDVFIDVKSDNLFCTHIHRTD